MLAKIREFFNNNLVSDQGIQDQASTQLAVAALLVEVARADYQDDPRENTAIRRALERAFGIPAEAIDELMDLAQQEAHDAVSTYQFTSLIRDHYDPEQRTELLRGLWQVAYADGRLDKYEEHLIRKVADLLYIRHSDFIRIKHEVMSA